MKTEGLENLIDFLLYIVRKPGVFGVNRVEDINFLWTGYRFGNGDKALDSLLTGFRLFVNRDFDTTKKNHDWSKLIRLYSGSDKHSLELFGKLFIEYLSSNGIDIKNERE